MSSPTVDELREIGIFGALSDDALAHLCAALQPRAVGPGEVIFREGEHGNTLYVILSGEVEVLKAARSGRDVRVAMLGPREWFGEMGPIDVMPRSATLRAIAPCSLLPLSSADLDALYRRDLKAYALLALNIAREVSRRLRVADGLLADLMASYQDAFLSRRA